MLIITRKPNEILEIGNNVKVTILGIRGNKIRLGIDAPKDVDVHRSEIASKIRDENGGVIPGRDAT